MLWAVSSEQRQGPWWILKVSSSLPTIPGSPIQLPGNGTSTKDISPVQLGQRSKCSNTRGKITQSHATSVFPLSPRHRAHAFSWIADNFQIYLSLSFFFKLYCESLFQAFPNILLHPIFYDSVKMHKKRNVFMKCSLSFSFAFKSNCLNPSVE